MQTQNPPLKKQVSPAHIELPEGLPEGAEIQQVAFVTEADAAQTTIAEFKEPHSCRAVLVTDHSEESPVAVTMLLVPANDHEDPELMAKVWSWVEPGIPEELRRGFLIMLWGVRIIWSPGRTGLIASANRLEAVRRAIVDFSFYEEELRKIEAKIAQIWPHLHADTPLAFRFEQQALPRREQLAQRFQQVMELRSRLLRIDPAIHHPLVHPATLASQLNERLKERTQLSERIEFVDDQLEHLERIYEMCGDRSSDFVNSQNEARLEWIVIVLLATETVALLVELLTSNWI